MLKKILVLTFMDEGGKQSRLTVNNPKEGLDADTAKSGAQAIVDAGVFRAKGKYVAPVQAQIVTTNTGILFGE